MSSLSKKTFIYIVLSIFLSIISLVIILSVTDKYHISLINKERSNSDNIIYYHDLDKDGYTEKIHFSKDNAGRISFIVYVNDKIINHWNFEGVWGRNNKPFIGDIDNDDKDEVFLFSQIKDSLYLHCVDPINNKTVFRNKAITKVYKAHGRYDFSTYPGILYDMDYDGIKEIYFSISSGYSTKPRNLFAYNYIKDTVISSPESCVPLYSPIAQDFDDDSIPEFFCATDALGNCNFSRDYTDQYSWLMIFNPDLSFKFKPIPFNAYPSATEVGILNQIEKFIFVLHHYRGTGDYSSFMSLVNSNGLIHKTKNLNKDQISQWFTLINDPQDFSFIYLITNKGVVSKIDTNLNIKKHLNLPELTVPIRYHKLDIDNDGRFEYIFRGQSLNQIIITRHDLKNAISFTLDDDINFSVFSVKESNPNRSLLSMDTNLYTYTFQYGKSLAYKYWYFMFIINAMFIYLVFYITSKVKEYRKLKIRDTEKKISELQLKSFQNQIDPHFTFNIIETFGNLINEKNAKKAGFIFNNYTKLLKSVIINSDRVFIPLKEELDFVKSYLDLEVYRNNYKFNYQFNIPDELNENIIIPKMLVHIFVENAIKHGIRHLNSDGIIKIEVSQKNGSYYISIEDNGIGREKAKELSGFSTGKGLKIIDEILELYNKLYRINISHKIIDLRDNDKPSGTLIKIKIPTNE